MKLGVSSYSLFRAIRDGEMTIVDAVHWIAENGGEHIEIVPMGFDLKETPALIDEIRTAAADAGIDISNYAVGGNFLADDEETFRGKILEAKGHVDIAHRLGVKLMRHDVAFRPVEDTSILQFERDLPKLVEACREVADYAAQYGITTSVENHGYFVQAADRVQRLIHEVDRPNFRTTLDVGNFVCVDENPAVSVRKNIGLASMVHLKDFYIRPPATELGEGWFASAGGYRLRGAITGHGDLDLGELIRIVKSSGYDGYISIEFEGMEECKRGTRLGLELARAYWNKA